MASLGPSNPPKCRVCRLPLAHTTATRRHGCPFCERAFQRVDGARRHAKICPLREGRPLPPEAKRGRKVHACDACSRIKVLCDGKNPCARCASRVLTCTYGRFCTDPTHCSGSAVSEKMAAGGSNHPALSFLLGCADPSGGPVDEVILDGEPEHGRNDAVSQDYSGTRAAVSDTIDPRLLFLDFVGPLFDPALDYDGMDCAYLRDAMGRLHLGISDAGLEARIGLLSVDLHEVAVAMPDFESLPDILGTFPAFFKTTTFRDCITSFFHRGHLLATIIHLPTFDLGLVDPTLLLAITLSGFAYLYYRKETPISPTSILMLQDLAEKYIFHRVNRCLGANAYSADSREALELCQAAYLIETLQMFVKDPRVRQRVVHKRHPALVAFLRGLDVMGSRHGSLELELDWDLFVCKESWIRLVTWTFINDAWLIIFSNHPPAMTLSDMRGYLPCIDGLWRADSPTSFDRLRTQKDFSPASQGLAGIVSGLLGDEWTENTATHLGKLDVQHLHVAVLAFQHVMFHYHTSVLVNNSSSVVLRGLDRWNLLWDAAITGIDIEEQKWLGVVKYSTGIAFISKRIMEVGKTEVGKQSKYLQRTVTYDTLALYQFLRRFCIEDSIPIPRTQ